MPINNPLIKASHTALIMNKTADLKLVKNEEQQKMKISKRQGAHLAATIGEDGIGSRLTKEQIAEIKQAYDDVANKLGHIFAHTSAVTPSTVRASQATAAFFNSQQNKKPEEPENTNDNAPKFRK